MNITIVPRQLCIYKLLALPINRLRAPHAITTVLIIGSIILIHTMDLKGSMHAKLVWQTKSVAPLASQTTLCLTVAIYNLSYTY